MAFTTLISADELAAIIDRCVVVDCRHDLMDPQAGIDGYNAAHIPNAQFLSRIMIWRATKLARTAVTRCLIAARWRPGCGRLA